MPQISQACRNTLGTLRVVALWVRSSARMSGARSGLPAGTSVGRSKVCGKGRKALVSRKPMTRLTAFPRFVDAAIPIEAGIDERSEEPNPVPLVRGCFQAARGREASGSASQVQRIIVRKIRRKSLRHELKPNDDLLSIRRGTSPSNREIMAKTQPIPSRASTDCCGVPVSVEVCVAIACVNLR